MDDRNIKCNSCGEQIFKEKENEEESKDKRYWYSCHKDTDMN